MLFEIFSQNLAYVKHNPHVRMSPDFDDGVVCPICFKFFPREALSQEYDDSLTLEDVPPAALGGHPLVLTCKICNNNAGYKLDAHLLRKLKFDRFLAGSPNIEIEARFRPTKDIRLPATIQFSMDGHLDIRCDPSRTDPEQIRRFNEYGNIAQFNTLTLDFLPGHKINRPEIALLRIAYLLAFAKFGYGLLMNQAIQVVRQQIQFPEKTILPDWGIMPGNFPDETVGINVLIKPKELMGFFVVFDLSESNQNTRYGILLPGPYSSIRIYNRLAELRSNTQENPLTFSVQAVEDLDYLGDEKLAMASSFMIDPERLK